MRKVLPLEAEFGAKDQKVHIQQLPAFDSYLLILKQDLGTARSTLLSRETICLTTKANDSMLFSLLSSLHSPNSPTERPSIIFIFSAPSSCSYCLVIARLLIRTPSKHTKLLHPHHPKTSVTCEPPPQFALLTSACMTKLGVLMMSLPQPLYGHIHCPRRSKLLGRPLAVHKSVPNQLFRCAPMWTGRSHEQASCCCTFQKVGDMIYIFCLSTSL